MRFVLVVVGALCLFGVGAAVAANGYTTDSVHMFAGPSDQYPAVMRLSAGRPLTIHGCLPDFAWCDVSWRGNRGWVTGFALEALSRERRVGTADSGHLTGVPVVDFDVQDYWEDNYRDRPWYADRTEWFRVSIARPQPREVYPDSAFGRRE